MPAHFPATPPAAAAAGDGRGPLATGAATLAPACRLASANRASRVRSRDRGALTVTGQRARRGGTAAAPQADQMPGDPAGAPPAQTSSNGENSRQRSSPQRMLRAISCAAIADVFSP